MDIAAGTNHWLPAYGFQQPGQLQQVLDNDDGGTMLIAGQQQPFLFLETIIEETSDDLRSESDRSGPAGWPDSDSDTASVIHVPNSLECCDSGSERDLAVPKKRRRQDVEEDQASLSSRSSSLLQFECLERHCEDVFRTSDPFQDLPSPSVTSSFSFDSLESNRWRFSTSPDSLDDNSDCSSASSDDTLHHSSSWSSRSGSFRSRLRSFRSFDSLNLLQPPPPQCPKQPAPQPTSKPQRSAENLSEDSGFGDQCGAVATVASATVGTILEDESSYYSDSSAGAASSETSGLNLEELRGWNVKFNSSCWQSAPSLVLARDTQLAMASSAPNLRGHVTFSPVVSEVSWRDSYSDNEDAEKLEASQSVQKLQIGVPVEATGERERVIVDLTPMERGKKTTSRLGGFFQRFSLRRNKKHKEDKRKEEAGPVLKDASYEDVTIIPLHPPPSDVVSSKPPLPPLPPRSVPAPRRRPDANVCAIDPAPVGLLETDLDSDVSTVRNGAAPANKKAKSLLNLQPDVMLKPPPGGSTNRPLTPADSRAKSMEFLLDKENQAAVQPPENELQKGGAGERVLSEHQLRVQRSLQKLNVPDWYKNSSVARGPEGFLLKRGSDQGWPGLGSKTTSLSSLGSTQSAAARSPTSHLLSPSPTPHVFTRWSTSRLNSGGTSASTSPCGSTRSSFNYRQPYLGWRSQERLARPRTPAERLAAGLLPLQQQQQLPSPPQISHQQQMEQDLQHEAELDQLQREDEEQMQQVPNLSEVRTSIKEVTSAIVHYVSGVREGSGDSLSPPRGADWGTTSTPRGSPRGSSGRLCWLESSFVGSRPLDSPETPLTLTSADVNKTLETLQQQQQQQQRLDGSWNVGRKVSGPGDLYLDLNSTSQRHQNLNVDECVRGAGAVAGPEEDRDVPEQRNKPSPGSTTLEDVLDSLLGLPPTSRSPSPGSTSPSHCRPPAPHHHRHSQRRSCGDLRSDLAGSASDGPPVDPPPYYVSDTLRRRSEGNAPRPIKQSGGTSLLGRGGRRVSFDMTSSSGSGQQQQQAPPPPPQQPEDLGGETVVRCRYSKCGRTASVAEARRTFKTCHNCSHVYCSRECRRAHWERHRKTCLHSRVGALCRQVLATAREDPATLRHLSLLARRGYLAQGRGAVKSFFSSPELAERFVSNGFSDLGEPAFVRWADLLPGEMGADLYSELLRLCKSYNPDTRFVLYVAVCVVSEVPTSGAVKWERQLVSRCAKLRLCRSLAVVPQQPSGTPQRRVSPCNITRDSENPETLILTSLPGCQGQMPPQRAREISFTNIQRHLRQRGVSLRRHFPDVYKRLCAYVEGTTERFTPVTVYPRDALTGKSFMCIIMPDAEPEKLELVPRDSSRVQTIDISLEHDT